MAYQSKQKMANIQSLHARRIQHQLVAIRKNEKYNLIDLWFEDFSKKNSYSKTRENIIV